jgi:hypothetical protein
MSAAARIYETPLPREEFDARLAEALGALDGAEGVEIREQLAWFMRRYPTPLERLAYCRRKYREAMATQAAAKRRQGL